MFESVQDSPRLARAKQDSANAFSAKKAAFALVPAVVVFAIQSTVLDTTAGSKLLYSAVTWLVTYLVVPAIEFGWHYLVAPFRIAEDQVVKLEAEKNELAETVSELKGQLFELNAKVAHQKSNQAMADWLTFSRGVGFEGRRNCRGSVDA